ncbi:potassium voltage-gated channel protein Shaw-like [Littorina saxatilis]|uniref:BTB domain-containing protein n=1 Tax=Littorina saxatilis TaxID=31220 RepID=A0AAN9AQ41_9CAEN
MDTSKRLTLNVGGQIFMTTTHTLCALPTTRLGRLAKEISGDKEQKGELFFDRNPEVMNSVLDLYRKGELHIPKNLCGHTVEQELNFWQIPMELIHHCCYKNFDTHKGDEIIIQEIDEFLHHPYESEAAMARLSILNKFWLIMERPNLSRASRIWCVLYFVVVMMSVLVYAIASSMAFRVYRPWLITRASKRNLTVEAFTVDLDLKQKFFASEPVAWIQGFESVFFTFFIVEYLLRIVTCPGKAYFFSMPQSWFDLFLLLQQVVVLTVEKLVVEKREEYTVLEKNALTVLFCLSILRVLRIFNLAKDFEAMKILILCSRASLKDLALMAMSLMSMATMFGASIYVVEMLEEGFTFDSILYGMWYAVITMTTVGYGDYFPVTTSGMLVGAMCALSGVLVIALPVTTIACKFSSYRTNYIARQHMIARVIFLKANPRVCTRFYKSVCGNDSGSTTNIETRGVESHTDTATDKVRSHTTTATDGVKSYTETATDGVQNHTETATDGVKSQTETPTDGVKSHTKTETDGVQSNTETSNDGGKSHTETATSQS